MMMNNLILADKHKYRDQSWDFDDADTKKYTHCFHAYPAMMIPQVAGRILDEFGENAKILFDPYCGTGTSLVEANIRGIDAVGTDINPLARLIAKVKTTIIPIKDIDDQLEDFNNYIFSVKIGEEKPEPNIPKFKNIDYWFKKDVKFMLAVVKEYIENIKNEDLKDFFKVAFSETVREVSLTRNGEFKLYRISPRQMEKFNPDVTAIMMQKLIRNRNGMKEYISLKQNDSKTFVYGFNTVYGIPKEILPPNSVDIVITSPPYGDSRTTVAYGQFSRFSMEWLGMKGARELDKKSMGGKKIRNIVEFDLPVLDKVIEKIAEKDHNRAYDVISFYKDYLKSIQNVGKVVKKGGIVAYVVGNRKVKGIEIPNDEITKKFFEWQNFSHVKTIIRKIPNKRMPKRNSPTNIAGVTDETMNYEYIVILQKDVS